MKKWGEDKGHLGKHTQLGVYPCVLTECYLSGETGDIPVVWGHQGQLLGLGSDLEDDISFS